MLKKKSNLLTTHFSPSYCHDLNPITGFKDLDRSATKITNVREGGKIPNYLANLDIKVGSRTKSLISVPIIVDGIVYGSILATNRIDAGDDPVTSRITASIVKGKEKVKPKDREKEKEKSVSTSFGCSEEILLRFIAVNAGLAMKHSSMYNGASSTGDSSGHKASKLPLVEVESAMQQLVNTAFADLDADLVSVFAYNDATKRLECTVSRDIKGLSIPIDRGIAGTSFRMGRVINVKEIAADDRHNHDVDAQVGYTTQTLLCAPILDVTGRPVGVMQALNKKGARHFTKQDENTICLFCKKVSLLLQDADYLRDCSDHCNNVLVAKYLSALISCNTVNSMVQVVRRLLVGTVACDYVGLYTYVAGNGLLGDHLLSQDSSDSSNGKDIDSGRILLKDVPSQIVDALRSGLTTELSISKANKLSSKLSNKNAHENFLPGISARHAIIYPINARCETDVYALKRGDSEDVAEGPVMISSGVLVVIRGSQSLLSFSPAARDILDLFVAVLSPSIEHVLRKEVQDTTIASLVSNISSSNSTLASLEDYIVLINSAGNIVKQNRDMDSLLGSGSDVSVGTEGQDFHYSIWFNSSNCKELADDIHCAVQTFITNSGSVNISSSAILYPSSPSCDISSRKMISYQLLSLDMKGSLIKDGGASIVLIIQITSDNDSCGDSKTLTPLYSYHEASSEKKNELIDLSKLPSSAELSRKSIDLEKNRNRIGKGARDVVNTAAELLKSVRTESTVPDFVQRELDDVTSILDILSPKISITTPTKTSEIEKIFELVSRDITPPEDLFSWDFNVLRIDDRNGLVNALGLIFHSLHLLESLGINSQVLANYIRDVSCRYHDNPFHNLHHATYVTQFAYMLIHATDANKYLSPRQLFGVVLSAVVHDVDHPRNTNMFEINSQSSLALIYNDQSVLENHHCSTAFQLMRKTSSNIFSGLSKSIALELRKIIVTCVMATDMSVHFELVDETKKIVSEGDFSFTDLQDQMFLCKLLVHSADLSNPVRPFHITQAWARRISSEFNLQVAKEQELSMPVLNFMITPDDKALCKNETGFASFVVAPMWRSLSGLFPGLIPLVKQLDSNLLSWKTMLEKIMKEEEAERSLSTTIS